MAGKEGHPDIIAARMQVLGEITQRLRSIPATVKQQNGRRIRAAPQFEAVGAGDDSIASYGQALQRVVAMTAAYRTRKATVSSRRNG